MKQRIIPIGDVHGCLYSLAKLLGLIKPKTNDVIVFLGDYIDRGLRSSGVIEALIDMKRTYPNMVCLKGNHEDMFIRALAGDRYQEGLFLYNGGTMPGDSYTVKETPPVVGEEFEMGGVKFILPDSHRKFLDELPTHFETDDYIFVHAGLYPTIELKDQNDQDKMWIRADFLESKCKWDKIVVHGHTPGTWPHIDERRIGLDTGVVFGGRLTALDLTNDILYSVGKHPMDKLK